MHATDAYLEHREGNTGKYMMSLSPMMSSSIGMFFTQIFQAVLVYCVCSAPSVLENGSVYLHTYQYS